MMKAKDAVIIASSQKRNAYGNRECITPQNGKSMASGLFAALREADAKGKKEIIIEGTSTAGSDLAFMNRALRAADFNVKKP